MSIAILDRPIAFHRCFAELAGSAEGGIFLSQMVYWHNRVDREFYKTADEIYEETMIKKDRQLSIRRKLIKKGILSEELRGLPAKLFYKINEENLRKSLNSPVTGIPPTGRRNSSNKKEEFPQLYTETTTETTTKDLMCGSEKTAATPRADSELPKPKKTSAHTESAKIILDFLNENTGKAFQPVPTNIKPIVLRMQEVQAATGCTLEAAEQKLRTMTMRKIYDWQNDPDMAKYLRPATLYNATKCHQYIGECVVDKPKRNNGKRRQGMWG